MPTQDENLKMMATFISQPARKARSASFVMNAADAFFHQEQSRFTTFVGNTMTFWQTPTKQTFANAGHKWSAVRSGLVWSVLKQVNIALRARGMEIYVDDVPVMPEMGVMLRTILGAAGMALTAKHSEQLLFNYLEIQKPNFIGALELFPDGAIPEAAP